MHFMFAKCCKCLRKISKLTMMKYNLVVDDDKVEVRFIRRGSQCNDDTSSLVG
jgi:hypothetical protein